MNEQNSEGNYPEINIEECKGCEKCIAACPKNVLSMSCDFNSRGYNYAVYEGSGCTGCGICFYCCPEPYALNIHKAGKTSVKQQS